MKIRSIRAVQARFPEPAASGTEKKEYETAPRPSWMESGPVANPKTRYPRYAAYRPSWTPTWGGFGCLVEAEDGSWGFATASHGRPVAAVIDDYLGRGCFGESCLATEKCYDMMVRMGSAPRRRRPPLLRGQRHRPRPVGPPRESCCSVRCTS